MLDDPRRGRARFRWAVVVLLLLGFGLGVLNTRSERVGRADPVTSAVQAIFSPAIRGLHSFGAWWHRELSWIAFARRQADENRRLRRDLADTKGKLSALQEAEATNRRLRALLGFRPVEFPKRIPADVIALQALPDVDTMLIGCGTRHGVKPNAVVVAPAGVVGYVIKAGATTSTVLLITDSACAIGGRVQRANSRVMGVCRGRRNGTLEMLFVNGAADLRAGDAIVSSGLGAEGGIFPKGLPIGTVTLIDTDAAGTSRTVVVQPAVQFDRLEEVFVLQ